MQAKLQLDCLTRIDQARACLREVLKEEEYARLSGQLELIERDRRIKNEFKRLKKQGISGADAIFLLAEQFFLSSDRIDEIVYLRTRQIRRGQEHVNIDE